MSIAKNTIIAAAAILFSTSMAFAEDSGSAGDTTTGASGAGTPHTVGVNGGGPAVKTRGNDALDTPPTSKVENRSAAEEVAHPKSTLGTAPKQ